MNFAKFGRDLVFALIFLFILVLSLVDLVADLREGVSSLHLFQEALAIIIAVVGLTWILTSQVRLRRQHDSLMQELQTAREKSRLADEKLLEARSLMHQLVEDQFANWQLSKSEAQVGWLLLKGLSHREIAMIRSTQEKTVRTQASAIYQKAGLEGRHAFAAWFLEDIL